MDSRIAAVVLIAVVVFAVFIVPLSPTLSVIFKIGHSAMYPYMGTLEITAWRYARQTLSSVSGMAKGNITLTGIVQGQYDLQVVVMYQNQVLSAFRFTSLGEGTYELRTVYWPRPEETQTPYNIFLTLYLQDRQVASAKVDIYPI